MTEQALSGSANGAECPPVVSVITIFYNAPVVFFQEAIDSVLAQTETQWELLLVDDGSTDQSSDIARRAVATHPDRMRLLTHPGGSNRGMSASRNLGIGAAQGEFVAFLDADDVYLPEKLERQIAVLNTHPEVGMVFGPTLHWWSWTGDPADRQRDSVRRLGGAPETVVPAPELVRAYLERRADTPATCGVLIRRAAIEDVGGFDARFPDLYEDQAFFFKLLLVESAYVEGQAWDRYRRHPDAMCEVRIREGKHSDDYSVTAPRRSFLEWLTAYFRQTAVADGDLRRLLGRELWPYRHPWLQRSGMALRSVVRTAVPRPARRAARWCLRSLRSRRRAHTSEPTR
jgi:glycosyltransferase involved in cell wall biosynthesis